MLDMCYGKNAAKRKKRDRDLGGRCNFNYSDQSRLIENMILSQDLKKMNE